MGRFRDIDVVNKNKTRPLGVKADHPAQRPLPAGTGGPQGMGTLTQPTPDHGSETPLPPVPEDEARRAYERTKPIFEALHEDQPIRIRVDMAKAAGIVLAAEPKIRAIAADIETQIPN